MAKARAKKDTSGNTLLLALLGGTAGVGLYFLLKDLLSEEDEQPQIHPNVVLPMPPVLPVESILTWNGLLARLRDLDTLWKSGQIPPNEVLLQLSELNTTAGELRRKQPPPVEVEAEIARLVEQIRRSVAATGGATVPA